MGKVTKSKNIKSFPLQFSVTGHAVIFTFGTSKSRIAPFWCSDFDVLGEKCTAPSPPSLLSQVCAHKQGELGPPGPAEPQTLPPFPSLLSRVQTLTRQQSPRQALCWWAACWFLHHRDAEQGMGGLETMPFLREIMSSSDTGSSTEFEPSLSPELQTIYHKAVLSNSDSEQTESCLISLLIIENGTANLRACVFINLSHGDKFLSSPFL